MSIVSGDLQGLESWLRDVAGQLHVRLEQQFGPSSTSEAYSLAPTFDAPFKYALMQGGKRMRPALVIAASQALGDDVSELAWAGAIAVELIHTYSLVHDDLPCMDDDDERRGSPTTHKVYDEATALLVGDALQTAAFAVLSDAPGAAERKIRMVSLLAKAAGARGMVGGQVLDIAGFSKLKDASELLALHRGKTGALIEVSATLGAIASGGTPKQIDRLARYGALVGLAFQLADDVLDADEDAVDDTPNMVKYLGVDGTRARAHEVAEEAIALAHDLPKGDRLVALAQYTVRRTL